MTAPGFDTSRLSSEAVNWLLRQFAGLDFDPALAAASTEHDHDPLSWADILVSAVDARPEEINLAAQSGFVAAGADDQDAINAAVGELALYGNGDGLIQLTTGNYVTGGSNPIALPAGINLAGVGGKESIGTTIGAGGSPVNLMTLAGGNIISNISFSGATSAGMMLITGSAPVIFIDCHFDDAAADDGFENTGNSATLLLIRCKFFSSGG